MAGARETNWFDGAISRTTEDDGIAQAERVRARLEVWNPATLAWERMTQPSASGGGGAVTVADGADVAQGSTADPSSASTVVGLLKAVKAAVAGTLTVATHAVTQSGVWTVARSWTLSSATDSVNVGNFPATQPVSGTVTAVGPLTDTQLRAARVPVDASGVAVPVTDNGGSLTVDGTVGISGTVPVSLAANTPDVTDRAGRLLGKVRQTDGTLDLTLLSSAPSADIGQVAVPVREVSKIAVADKYVLTVTPRVLTAAATDLFDLFNASGSGKTLRVWGIYPTISTRAATAFVVSWVFSLVKTSAVGTGGSAHTYKNATPGLADGSVTIAPHRTGAANLPAQVTARAVPTGGATVLYVLTEFSLCPEESAGVDKLTQFGNLVCIDAARDQAQYIELAQGEGLKIRQITATASTGAAFGWVVLFDLV